LKTLQQKASTHVTNDTFIEKVNVASNTTRRVSTLDPLCCNLNLNV